jgi:hypothetical protein
MPGTTATKLTPAEAEAAFLSGNVASSLTTFDPVADVEAMQRFVPGLIGCLLRQELVSISSPQIGESLPVIVTAIPGDYLRIFVDPSMAFHGTDVDVLCFTYHGEGMYFSTTEVLHHNPALITNELWLHSQIFKGIDKERGA